MANQNQIRRNYNRLACWYDLLAEAGEKNCRKIGLEGLSLSRGMQVLEIGSGTGQGLLTIARRVGETGQVYGLDIAEQMLWQAKSRISSFGSPPPVYLICGNGVCLPFATERFDAVFMSFTLELFDEPGMQDVLAECWRVLRPRGRIGLVSMAKADQPGLMMRVYAWCHRRLPNLIDCRPIDGVQTLEAAGFRVDVRLAMSLWGLAVTAIVGGKHDALAQASTATPTRATRRILASDSG